MQPPNPNQQAYDSLDTVVKSAFPTYDERIEALKGLRLLLATINALAEENTRLKEELQQTSTTELTPETANGTA